MENYYTNPVMNAPTIFFDAKNHLLEIKGESYPENAREFFNPIMAWLREYLDSLEDQQVIVNIDLKYFNSSTAKTLINMFTMMDASAKNGKHITINWIYDEKNLNAVEYGEDFKEDLEAVKFHLIPKTQQ